MEKFSEDVKAVAKQDLGYEKLSGKTLLISGGTGFIGSFLCDVIRFRNAYYKQNIKIISLSRRERASDSTVTYVSGDVTKPLRIDGKIDYVLHLASNTHPYQYKTDPVGTITANVFGTYNLLTVARDCKAERFLLASSCEIYGDGKKTPMEEDYCGYINCNTARAGYNESKRVSESLCNSFLEQFKVPFVTVRLARVFGADRTKKDTKAMAQFIEKAVNKQDIVLKSKGEQKYSYVYVADAVSGILKVLLCGKTGEAYNVSADADNCTLGDYAKFLAESVGRKVVFEIESNSSVSQAQNALLDNKKLKELGWKPNYKVKDGLKRTVDILSSDEN